MTNERARDGWHLVEQVPDAAARRVLLLPGFLGSHQVYGRLLSEPALVEAGVHLIAADPPGSGAAGIPNGFDFGMQSHAESVEALCEAERVDLVVGHGLSANVGIEMAARGRYEGKLMLISAAFDRAAESRQLQDLERAARRGLLRSVAWPWALRKLEALTASYVDDAALRAMLLDAGRQTPPPVARRMLLGYFDHLDTHTDLTKRLIRTRTPVCVVRGDRDGIRFTTEHEAVLKASNLIQRYLVLGARHFAMLDAPDQVAKLIVRFLA